MEIENFSQAEWKNKVSAQLKTSSVDIFSVEIEKGIDVSAYNTTQNINAKASFNSEPIWVENIENATSLGNLVKGNSSEFIQKNISKGIVECYTLEEIESLEKQFPTNEFQYWWNIFHDFETQENININWEEISSAYLSIDTPLRSKIYFFVDVSLHQNAGAHYTDQLAIVLSKLNELVTHFSPTILEKCVVKMALGGNYLVEISKIRALHWLLDNFCKAFEKESSEIKIGTISTQINKTQTESENNLIRSTLEIAAGILGGANYVEFIPFSSKENQQWVEEVSLKQALILSHESLLNFYNDALAGSYTLENLSFELAKKAWGKFQFIEKQGGYLIEFPKIIETIQQSLEEYVESINEKITKIIGYNLYESKEFTPIEKPKETKVLKPFILP